MDGPLRGLFGGGTTQEMALSAPALNLYIPSLWHSEQP
jgi:hypothetical protein